MRRVVVPLSIEDLAAIASAPASATASEMARRLGRPYFTVNHALKRIRRAGGWYCRLTWSTCLVCRQPLAGSPQGRKVHPQCRRARVNQLEREYRKRRPGQSTPYVRAYRATPDGREKHTAYNREYSRRKVAEYTPEEWAPLLDKLHAADQRDYPLTLESATSSGLRWTDAEDRYVLEHLHVPARDVALALGRTLWAVRGRRMWLRRTGEHPEAM